MALLWQDGDDALTWCANKKLTKQDARKLLGVSKWWVARRLAERGIRLQDSRLYSANWRSIASEMPALKAVDYLADIVETLVGLLEEPVDDYPVPDLPLQYRRVFQVLARAEGRIVPFGLILDAMYFDRFEDSKLGDQRTLRVVISKMRTILNGKFVIKNHVAIGYSLHPV